MTERKFDCNPWIASQRSPSLSIRKWILFLTKWFWQFPCPDCPRSRPLESYTSIYSKTWPIIGARIEKKTLFFSTNLIPIFFASEGFLCFVTVLKRPPHPGLTRWNSCQGYSRLHETSVSTIVRIHETTFFSTRGRRVESGKKSMKIYPQVKLFRRTFFYINKKSIHLLIRSFGVSCFIFWKV